MNDHFYIKGKAFKTNIEHQLICMMSIFWEDTNVCNLILHYIKNELLDEYTDG